MIDVNVGPALWLTPAAVPYLQDRGSGSIVHVAARPGLEPAAGMAASAVSKPPWSTSPACSTWSCARSGSG
jgi:NADP-dependent 3-hydroxy acid dehydrogenase YdfG